MHIPASLLAAYRDTEYRVRLGTGGYATIRVGEPLPAALRPLVPSDMPWAFLTACNPLSTATDRQTNREKQRQLLHALQNLPCVRAIHAACGVGRSGWREPSLFVMGLDTVPLDGLIERFQQHAAVVGCGASRARLRTHRSASPP